MGGGKLTCQGVDADDDGVCGRPFPSWRRPKKKSSLCRIMVERIYGDITVGRTGQRPSRGIGEIVVCGVLGESLKSLALDVDDAGAHVSF